MAHGYRQRTQNRGSHTRKRPDDGGDRGQDCSAITSIQVQETAEMVAWIKQQPNQLFHQARRLFACDPYLSAYI